MTTASKTWINSYLTSKMPSNDSKSSSLPSSNLLQPEDREALVDLQASRGWRVFSELVNRRLLTPALSRLKGAQEVPDMCRAQGSVESLEKVLSLLPNTLRSSQGGKPV